MVINRELPRVVNEAEAALIGLGRETNQRGGQSVRLPVGFKRASRRESQIPELS
jgi:hypothetical protein